MKNTLRRFSQFVQSITLGIYGDFLWNSCCLGFSKSKLLRGHHLKMVGNDEKTAWICLESSRKWCVSVMFYGLWVYFWWFCRSQRFWLAKPVDQKSFGSGSAATAQYFQPPTAPLNHKKNPVDWLLEVVIWPYCTWFIGHVFNIPWKGWQWVNQYSQGLCGGLEGPPVGRLHAEPLRNNKMKLSQAFWLVIWNISFLPLFFRFKLPTSVVGLLIFVAFHSCQLFLDVDGSITRFIDCILHPYSGKSITSTATVQQFLFFPPYMQSCPRKSGFIYFEFYENLGNLRVSYPRHKQMKTCLPILFFPRVPRSKHGQNSSAMEIPPCIGLIYASII